MEERSCDFKKTFDLQVAWLLLTSINPSSRKSSWRHGGQPKHSAPQAFLESCCEAFPKSFSADLQLLFPLIQIRIRQKKWKNRKISLEREHETSYSHSQTCCVDQVWSIWFCPEVMPQGLKNLRIWWSDPRKQLAAYTRNTSLIMTILLYSYSSCFFTWSKWDFIHHFSSQKRSKPKKQTSSILSFQRARLWPFSLHPRDSHSLTQSTGWVCQGAFVANVAQIGSRWIILKIELWSYFIPRFLWKDDAFTAWNGVVWYCYDSLRQSRTRLWIPREDVHEFAPNCIEVFLRRSWKRLHQAKRHIKIINWSQISMTNTMKIWRSEDLCKSVTPWRLRDSGSWETFLEIGIPTKSSERISKHQILSYCSTLEFTKKNEVEREMWESMKIHDESMSVHHSVFTFSITKIGFTIRHPCIHRF